jgi:parvulin-like peptidyl-prolyl isomerase
MDTPINCKFYAAIYEKAMAYMYDAESEDAANTANSARHSANFAALVAAQYQTDSRIGSGYYLGQRPDGSPDPNVRRG